MGKVWPPDSVAFNQATTRLSTITALDESPLVQGLIYAGTDDGLVNVTEDGGKNWRKMERLAGLPEYSYVTDVQPSPRDADTVFATFNNWQRGDYKPYVMRSGDRGRTWTSITGDLPARSGAWSIAQDYVDANLLFVGLEFGVYVTVDGGQHWVQLAGRDPDYSGARSCPSQTGGRPGRRNVRARCLHPRRLFRVARPHVASARRAGPSLPTPRRLSLQRAESSRSGLGRRGDSEPAIRRTVHLQPRRSLPPPDQSWFSTSPMTPESNCDVSSWFPRQVSTAWPGTCGPTRRRLQPMVVGPAARQPTSLVGSSAGAGSGRWSLPGVTRQPSGR